MAQNPSLPRADQDDSLLWAREVLRAESAAIAGLAERLDEHFSTAVDALRDVAAVMVTGMGKAGWIGQKLAATLASTGTPSHFLHPAEAIHGDLGRVRADDGVLALSNSGETEELVRILPSFRELGVPLVAITARADSTLGRYATVVVELGAISEACPLGLAPTASTAAMLAIGDALALTLSRQRGFEASDFARYHPGGSLGRRLARVDDVMRPLVGCRVASEQCTLREVLVTQHRPGRRTGAIMLVDAEGVLRGLFTDSDLARLFGARRDPPLDEPIAGLMTRSPKTVPAGARMPVALELLARHKISELPVVDERGRPVGLIDVTDVVDLPASPIVESDEERRDAPRRGDGSAPNRPPRRYEPPEEAAA